MTMKKKSQKASRRHPPRKARKTTGRKVRYATVNPGVSTLMLVNPSEARTVHKGIDNLSRKLARLETQLQSKGEPMARKRARKSRKRAETKPVDIGRVIQTSVQAAVKGAHEGAKMKAKSPSRRARRSHGAHPAPRRGADGRFLRDGTPNIHYLKRNRTASDRGLIALGRAHRSVRWEKQHGKPEARGYAARHFAAVNPGVKGALKQHGGAVVGALAGFYGARMIGNLAPKLPVVGNLLGGWSRVLGSAGVAALGFFLFPKRFAQHKTAFLSGAALALVDAGLRQVAPSLQGVLGDGPADIAVGQLPPAPEMRYLPPATGCDQPTGNYVPDHMSAYERTGDVAPDDMSGYVQTQPTGDSDDGVSGIWDWLRRRQTTGAPAMTHRPPPTHPYHPYRIVIDCPYPPHHVIRHLPQGTQIVAAHPAETMKVLPPPPPQQMPIQAQIAPVKQSVAGGIFGDGD
jgi:hypothetical protein